MSSKRKNRKYKKRIIIKNHPFIDNQIAGADNESPIKPRNLNQEFINVSDNIRNIDSEFVEVSNHPQFSNSGDELSEVLLYLNSGNDDTKLVALKFILEILKSEMAKSNESATFDEITMITRKSL